jgi:hypothetical protein
MNLRVRDEFSMMDSEVKKYTQGVERATTLLRAYISCLVNNFEQCVVLCTQNCLHEVKYLYFAEVSLSQ